MMTRSYLIPLCLLVVLQINCHAQEEYSKKVKFGALKMSYDDLSEIIQLSRSLTFSANGNPSPAQYDEYLQISDGESSYRLQKGFTKEAFVHAPRVAYDLDYSL